MLALSCNEIFSPPPFRNSSTTKAKTEFLFPPISPDSVCPIVIESEINTEAFIEKLRNAEHPLTKFLKWKDETVFLIDLPLPEHCRAISEISEQIYKQQINCPPGSRLIETRDVTTNIGKEGDTSFQPRDKPRPAQGQGCDVRCT
jgi:hypothetical protein